MGLFDFVAKQFIDVIQWTEPGDGILASRFPMAEMEIQNGASLTVRDSQLALFVDEGKVADVFNPGRYTLNTQTLPVLTYLKNWDKLFESPFKSDVYFFSTRLQLDRKWGTPNPITIRDKEFGIVRLRAFGIYSYRVTDPKKFYTEISGTRETYTVDDLDGQLRNTLIGAMTDLFAESNVPFLDMAANQDEFGARLKEKMLPLFERYGLALDNLVVQNVSLPEELQKVLDQRIGMNMVGDLGKYTQYQVAECHSRCCRQRRRRSRGRCGPGGRHRHGASDGRGHDSAERHRSTGPSARGYPRPAGKTPRAGGQGHPQPGRIRGQEG